MPAPRREVTWLLLLFTVALLAVTLVHLKQTAATARLSFRPLPDWQLRAHRLAFCSEQTAALRGYDLRVGPIQFYYLKWTHPPFDPGTVNKPAPESAPTVDGSVVAAHLGPVVEPRPLDPAVTPFE